MAAAGERAIRGGSLCWTSLSEARTARGEFVVGLVQRRLPKGDVSAQVAATIIETMSAAQARLACRMLAVEPLPGTFGPDYRTPLVDHAASSVGNRDRVGGGLPRQGRGGGACPGPPVPAGIWLRRVPRHVRRRADDGRS